MKTLLSIVAIALFILGGWWFFAPQDHTNELLVTDAQKKIVGIWESVEDSRARVVFIADGTTKDFYDEVVLATGTWELNTSVKHSDGEYNPSGVFLSTNINGEEFEYAVLHVSDTELSLSYLVRGNTLNYRRIKIGAEKADELALSSGEWKEYANEEYSFTLKHPDDWEVQEALKPQELRATHEIVIHEKEYEMWRSSFTVRIFSNEMQQSVQEWWDGWLQEEDTKESACREEHQGNAPCLFLRGLVESEEKTRIAGKDAIVVTLFRFDHEEVCSYIARGTEVVGLCAAGVNPNDSKEHEHRAITDEIRSSFNWLGTK